MSSHFRSPLLASIPHGVHPGGEDDGEAAVSVGVAYFEVQPLMPMTSHVGAGREGAPDGLAAGLGEQPVAMSIARIKMTMVRGRGRVTRAR